MPIWVKLIFMLWVITFVMLMVFRLWASADESLPRIVRHDYPTWVIATGWLGIASIVSIIPLFAWLLFFR